MKRKRGRPSRKYDTEPVEGNFVVEFELPVALLQFCVDLNENQEEKLLEATCGKDKVESISMQIHRECDQMTFLMQGMKDYPIEFLKNRWCCNVRSVVLPDPPLIIKHPSTKGENLPSADMVSDNEIETVTEGSTDHIIENKSLLEMDLPKHPTQVIDNDQTCTSMDDDNEDEYFPEFEPKVAPKQIQTRSGRRLSKKCYSDYYEYALTPSKKRRQSQVNTDSAKAEISNNAKKSEPSSQRKSKSKRKEDGQKKEENEEGGKNDREPNELYPCPECKQTYTLPRKVLKHVKEKHGDSRNIYNIMLKTEALLYDANIRYSSESMNIQECDICGVQRAGRAILRHLDLCHKDSDNYKELHQKALTFYQVQRRKSSFQRQLDREGEESTSDVKDEGEQNTSLDQSDSSPAFPCPGCKQTLTESGTLLKHIRTTHGHQQNFHKIMMRTENLLYERNKRYRSDMELQACSICGASRAGRAIFRHINLCHKDSPQYSDAYQEALKAYKIYRKSLTKKSDEKLMKNVASLDCKYCERRFKVLTTRRVHENFRCLQNPNRKKLHECKMCGFASISEEKYVKHCASHTNNRLKCDRCDKTYCTKSALCTHRRTIHKIFVKHPINSYTCHICGRTFIENNLLVKHIKTHSDARPFMCDQCGCNFKTASGVQKHQKMFHENRYKYHCEKCGHGMEKAKSLAVHQCGRVRRVQDQEKIITRIKVPKKRRKRKTKQDQLPHKKVSVKPELSPKEDIPVESPKEVITVENDKESYTVIKYEDASEMVVDTSSLQVLEMHSDSEGVRQGASESEATSVYATYTYLEDGTLIVKNSKSGEMPEMSVLLSKEEDVSYTYCTTYAETKPVGSEQVLVESNQTSIPLPTVVQEQSVDTSESPQCTEIKVAEVIDHPSVEVVLNADHEILQVAHVGENFVVKTEDS